MNSCSAQVVEPCADASTSGVAPAGRATWLHKIRFTGRLGFEAEGFPTQPVEKCVGFSIIQPYPLNNPVMYLLRWMALGQLSCNGHESTQAKQFLLDYHVHSLQAIRRRR